MKQENSKHIISVFFGILIVLLIYSYYNTVKDENALKSNNRRITYAKVTDYDRYYDNHIINFEFYVNGKLIETSDPYYDDDNWVDYTRKSNVKKNEFYLVEYDLTDPENSKLIVDSYSKSRERILENDGLKIKGYVESAFKVSQFYSDLRIKYHYLNNEFRFRTRLNTDSLPCGNIEDCKNSEIELTISKKFPALNNLDIISYDRLKMAKNKLEKQ
ncbi:hypothetical protein KO500_08195 [Cellulophaga baltica]|uniref:hypothetical protein n=1 Tax=Cellulophaga TaxID=104264 RepID=UPI001C06C1CB|nr:MULTISPECIES: hypothetical protein [Cellulophaga]MBU2996412.1 hypothetical protein [Cellulophaga baltica]MDO6767808.1 hypothetical protein [Cellulophaga sp. 1_MG-2023]